MEQLKYKDISVGDNITWHPNYHREEWHDPLGPLTVTDVYKIDSKTYFIGYKCLSLYSKRSLLEPIGIWTCVVSLVCLLISCFINVLGLPILSVIGLIAGMFIFALGTVLLKMESNCKRCDNPTFPIHGHHKLIKKSGNDICGHVTFIEKKKKTIINVEEQPVFIRMLSTSEFKCSSVRRN